MQFKPALILIVLVSSFSENLYSNPIYKSIDKNGNVTYSSTPTTNSKTAEKIAIPPPPSTQAIEEARARHQENLKTNQLLEETRQQREEKIAEKEAIKRKKYKQAEPYTPPEKVKEQGPYYGIPGHGILVLPKGPTINR